MKPQDQHEPIDRAIDDWTPAPRESDAEMAARWAAEALKDGRFELGRALANIAANAHRAETQRRVREVPMVGQTRDERPTGRTSTGDHATSHASMPDDVPEGPTGDGNADLPALTESTEVIPRAQEAQTELFGQPVSPAFGAPPEAGSRCQFTIHTVRGTEAWQEPCNVPIWWYHGDQMRSPGWKHVDPAVDQHHEATAGPGPIIGG